MILITGASGLVGSHLAFELVHSGQEVRLLKRPGSGPGMLEEVFRLYSDHPDELMASITWVDGDIMDIFSLEDAMDGIDRVYHCAALVSFLPQDKKRLMQINVQGTANVVNAALEKNIRKLCHVSSIAALGRPENQTDLIDETLVWKASRNNSVYAVSKYGAEREVWRGSAEGLDAVIINPGIVLGVAGKSLGSSRIFTTVAEGLRFYPPGKNGFVDVRDVAKAMIILMDSAIVSERFIVSAENLDYRHLFAMIAEEMGVEAPRVRVSPMLSGLAWRLEKARSLFTGRKPLITRETARTAVQQYEYSSDKLKTATGFEFITLEETVRHFCRIFRGNKI